MIPLFKTHYSINRSILTAEEAGTSSINGPKSIIDIAIENKLDRIFLCEDSMSGFIQQYSCLTKAKIKMIFGLRLTILDNMDDKTPESLHKESKIIVVAKNNEGYKKLIKLSSSASCRGFYYEGRLDWKELHQLWSGDLSLCVPFYDSFLFKNALTFSSCKPYFGNIKPIFFKESHGLPFDRLISDKIDNFTKGQYETLNTHSIYYEKDQDFAAFMSFKCIGGRTTLSKPNLEQMCSNEFSFESYLRKAQNA